MKLTPTYHDLVSALIHINSSTGRFYNQQCVLSQAALRMHQDVRVKTTINDITLGEVPYTPFDARDYGIHAEIVEAFDELHYILSRKFNSELLENWESKRTALDWLMELDVLLNNELTYIIADRDDSDD